MELQPCRKCGWDICQCANNAPRGGLPAEKKAEGRGPQSKHWAFTCNNYKCVLYDTPVLLDFQYLVFQEEIGEKGTPHLQGYIQFTVKKRGAWVTNALSELFDKAVSTRACAGSDEQNETYVTKEEGRLGGPYRFGVRLAMAGGKGGRSDLAQVKKMLDEGRSMKDIANEQFGAFIRYVKGLREYQRINTTPRDGTVAPTIEIIVGPSGTGKSRKALADNPGAYWFGSNGKWWDDYEKHDTVVFDEFYGHVLPFTILLRILDRYPLRLETKGGSVELTATKFVFTSNRMPEDWYNGEKTHQEVWAENPLKRRIDEFGKIFLTGVVHRRVAPVLVAPEDATFGAPVERRARPGDMFGFPPLDGG